MRQIAFILVFALTFTLAGCSPTEQAGSEKAPETAAPETPTPELAGVTTLPWPAGLPKYKHIVIVVEENKDWADIIGHTDAPYINTLAKEGALFTQSFGLEHHSQGNYYWLFSGDNQGVGFRDVVPTDCDDMGTEEDPVEKDPDAPYCDEGGYPFKASNLGQQLIKNGHSFKGYSQSLPEIGSDEIHTYYGDKDEGRIAYARKHVPWVSFSNVPNGKTVETSSNLRFEDFPADFNDLPTVSFVIPDLEYDMHNLHDKSKIENENGPCQGKGSVCVGDTWLKENIDAYYQWAKDNNSLLIFTFDEDNGMGIQDLTDPFVDTQGDDCKSSTQEDPENGDRDASDMATPCGWRNGVVTIFAGAHIKPGEYPEGKGITHVNVLRTIEAMYGLPKSGAQQVHALAGGITDDYIITDVFTTGSER